LDGTLDGRQRDKLYCGEGRDYYFADKNDYVDSSCEKKAKPASGVARTSSTEGIATIELWTRRSIARSSALL
jgi:hypothetical protein